jgi:hypothetical protein
MGIIKRGTAVLLVLVIITISQPIEVFAIQPMHPTIEPGRMITLSPDALLAEPGFVGFEPSSLAVGGVLLTAAVIKKIKVAIGIAAVGGVVMHQNPNYDFNYRVTTPLALPMLPLFFDIENLKYIDNETGQALEHLWNEHLWNQITDETGEYNIVWVRDTVTGEYRPTIRLQLKELTQFNQRAGNGLGMSVQEFMNLPDAQAAWNAGQPFGVHVPGGPIVSNTDLIGFYNGLPVFNVPGIGQGQMLWGEWWTPRTHLDLSVNNIDIIRKAGVHKVLLSSSGIVVEAHANYIEPYAIYLDGGIGVEIYFIIDGVRRWILWAGGLMKDYTRWSFESIGMFIINNQLFYLVRSESVRTGSLVVDVSYQITNAGPVTIGQNITPVPTNPSFDLSLTPRNIVNDPDEVSRNIREISGAQDDDDYVHIWMPSTLEELLALLEDVMSGNGDAASMLVIPDGWEVVDYEPTDPDRPGIIPPGTITQQWLDMVDKRLREIREAAEAQTEKIKNIPGDIGGNMAFDFDGNRNRHRMTTVFPFSIPFSFGAAITSLRAPPQAPRFEIDFEGTIFEGYVWVLDFEEFESIVVVVRWAVWIAFFIGLMMVTNKVIRW